MTIEDALKKIDNLILESSSESDKKTFMKFSKVLSEFKMKQLSKKEKELLENSLEETIRNIDSKGHKNNPKRSFRKFIALSIRTLNFVPKKYYSELCIGVGVALGVSLGISFGIPFGLPNGIVYGIIFGSLVGLIIGIFIGRYMDNKAESQNRILNI